jgi:hypothetical protein
MRMYSTALQSRQDKQRLFELLCREFGIQGMHCHAALPTCPCMLCCMPALTCRCSAAAEDVDEAVAAWRSASGAFWCPSQT